MISHRKTCVKKKKRKTREKRKEEYEEFIRDFKWKREAFGITIKFKQRKKRK